jgi:hypothetical protein
MRIRTLVLISLTAVLAANVNGNLRQSHPPVSQYQISANAPQKVKLELISPETKVIEDVVVTNKIKKTSRNSNRNAIAPNTASAQQYALAYMGEAYGWGQEQHECLVLLWGRESGWNYTAKNKSSGAYGIPQSLPGNKMASAGPDWRTNPQTQIKWGLSYIQGRYDTPCGAWSSFKKKGWY